MNNVELNLSTVNLNGLTSSGGVYTFIVDFFKADGTPLGNPNVPNSYTLNVSPYDGNKFRLNVPINPGEYIIPGVKIVVYNSTRDHCCHTETNFTINNSTGTPPVNAIMNGYKVTTKAGKTLYSFGTQDLTFSLSDAGGVKLNGLTQRMSFNNTSVVKPISLANYTNDMKPQHLSQLLSNDGWIMPAGLRLAGTCWQYFAKESQGTTLLQLHESNKVWDTFGNPATFESNSGQVERASFYLL